MTQPDNLASREILERKAVNDRSVWPYAQRCLCLLLVFRDGRAAEQAFRECENRKQLLDKELKKINRRLHTLSVLVEM